MELGIIYAGGVAGEHRLAADAGVEHGSRYCAEGDKSFVFSDVGLMERLEEELLFFAAGAGVGHVNLRDAAWAAAQDAIDDALIWKAISTLGAHLERRLRDPQSKGVVQMSGAQVRRVLRRAGATIGCWRPDVPTWDTIAIRGSAYDPCPYDDQPHRYEETIDDTF